MNNYYPPKGLKPEADPGRNARRITLGAAAVIAVVVLVGAGGWLAVRKGIFKSTPAGHPEEISTRQLTKGLPAGLIQEAEAVKSGEKTSYASGTTLYAVSYLSAKSLAENIDLYRNYIRANNWYLMSDAGIVKGPVPYFYAIKGVNMGQEGEEIKETLNVTFLPVDNKIEVHIGYSLK